MVFYYNTVTKETGFIGDLEILGWQKGEQLPENWVEVVYGEQPIINENQYFILNKPELIDGIWVAPFTVGTLSEDQIQKAQEAQKSAIINPEEI